MTNIADAERRVRTTLNRARTEFRAALTDSGTGTEPARLLFVGSDLRVDRLRRVVTTPGDPPVWVDGTIDSGHPLGRLLLDLFVGPVRFLDAETFCRFLVAAAAPGPVSCISETHAALFANIMVVEPVQRPEHELAIWVVAARELAAAHPDADLHGLLPPLWTAHDPAGSVSGSVGHDFAGDPEPATEQQWSALYVELARSLIPASRNALDAAGNDLERNAIARSYDDDLWTYVRNHLFAAVARELEAEQAP